MSILREATLSHQVVTKPRSRGGGEIASFFGQPAIDAERKVRSEHKEVQQLPKTTGGLYSFFKPSKEVKSNEGKVNGRRERRKETLMAKAEDPEVVEVKPKAKRRRRKPSTVVINSSSEDEGTQAMPTTSRHEGGGRSNVQSPVSLAKATVILLEEVSHMLIHLRLHSYMWSG